MATCRGDRQSALDGGMAFDVGEIARCSFRSGDLLRFDGAQRHGAVQRRDDFGQMVGCSHACAGNEGRFGRVGRGYDEFAAGGARRNGSRDDARDGPQLAPERKLAEEFDIRQSPCLLLLRYDDAERDREIEAPALLRHVGRAEMGCYPACRQVDAAVLQRGPNPVAAFADRRRG